jgi:L-alanine-DL-glutamate epimerase-like enolase superfamily enzyme
VEGGFGCGVRLTAANAGEALAIGARLQVRPLAFWETPLDESDAEGYRALRQAVAVPIAVRGSGGLDALVRTLVQHSLVDIVIPEIARFGLTGIRRLAYYCWLFRVRGAVACSGSATAIAAARAAAALYVPVTSAIAAPAPFVVMPAGAGVPALLTGAPGPGLGISAPPLTAPDFVWGDA